MNGPMTAPILLNMGKKSGRALKDLKRGRGKLVDEVNESLEKVRCNLGDAMDNKQLVPIVVIYKRKVKKRRAITLTF